MNSTPLVIVAFIAGYFVGQYLGIQGVLDELGEMPSWEQVQAEVAREGLQ